MNKKNILWLTFNFKKSLINSSVSQTIVSVTSCVDNTVSHKRFINYLLGYFPNNLFNSKNTCLVNSLFTNSILLDIKKRNMYTRGTKIVNDVSWKISYNTINSKHMAVYQGWKFNNSQSKNMYAQDNGTNHTHGTKTTCTTDQNCDIKTCPQVCGPISQFKIKGHNTHGFPTGKPIIELDKNDCNGNPKPQNWCPAQNEKNISTNELQNLTENDMSLDKKATDFFNKSQEIIDKINK